jgi:hypothetical protein
MKRGSFCRIRHRPRINGEDAAFNDLSCFKNALYMPYNHNIRHGVQHREVICGSHPCEGKEVAEQSIHR